MVAAIINPSIETIKLPPYTLSTKYELLPNNILNEYLVIKDIKSKKIVDQFLVMTAPLSDNQTLPPGLNIQNMIDYLNSSTDAIIDVALFQFNGEILNFEPPNSFYTNFNLDIEFYY